jgi:hypothetical protein
MPYSGRPGTAATILVQMYHGHFGSIYPDTEEVRTTNSKGVDKQEGESSHPLA